MKFGLMVLAFFFLFFQSKKGNAQHADIRILRSIVDNRNEKLDDAFYLLSRTAGLACLRFGLYGAGVFVLAKDSSKKLRGLNLASGILTAGGVAYGTKLFYQRNRPYVDFPDLEHYYEPSSASFPSTSTSLAFGTAMSLSLAYKKWYVTAPAFVWASAVGYSRMHLGVHYPSDVMAGALIGAGSSFVCYRLNSWLAGRYLIKRKGPKAIQY